MLRTLDNLRGMRIEATDGEIGSVEDFLFDDALWTIRYFVVNAGNWLKGREVLILPASVGPMAADQEGLPVKLTRQQVKNSPDVDLAEPVSRQLEEAVHRHYDWPNYWMSLPLGIEVTSGAAMAPPTRLEPESVKDDNVQPAGDPDLRSANELVGYNVAAQGGDVGLVTDFMVDDNDWHIRYMVIDASNWLAGRQLLIAPEWIDYFDWDAKDARVTLSREEIERSPTYEEAGRLTRDYEDRLYEHYGRKSYWR